MANTSIQLKKSGQTGNTPVTLAHGEVAINYADGKLYYKDDSNSLQYINNQDSFSTINVGGSYVLATSPTDILTIVPSSGINITPDNSSKRLTFSVDEDQIGSFVKKSGDTMTGDLNLPTANLDASYIIVENTLYSGLASRAATPLPNLIAQFTSNSHTYTQVNQQNIDAHGSADFVITADIGDDQNYYTDVGMTGSNYNYYEGYESPFEPLTGYFLVQGSTIGQPGGNMIVGTTTPNTNVRFFTGGVENSNVVMSLESNQVSIKKDLSVDGSITGPTITSMQNYTQAAFNKANSAYDYVITIPSGPQGYQGVQGAQGYQGVVGAQGSQGYQGVQGATGSQGFQGVVGAQGSQGVQGATGSQGNQGYQGVQGAVGAQGPSATLSPSSYVVKAVKGGSTQTIPNGSDTVVTFTDDFDPQNWWSSNKFQPTIQGYYSINVQVWWEQGSITNNQTNLQLRKNGSAQVAIAQNQITSSIGYFESINTTLYFNGSTDYVEVTAYTANPTSQNIASSSAGSWFNAELIAYGQTGAQGNQGNQGVQGATGAQGSTGSQGSQGVQGATGSQGNQGYQGVQGATGSQGFQGVVGAQGSQGSQGDTGAGLTTGGTTGELLQKNSSTNYDASWTDTLTGDLTYTGNVSFTGPVSISGTIEQVSGNNGVFFGYAANGFSALYAGYPTYTPLPVTVFQSSGNYDGYIQNNFENVNSGSNATADIVITADNGTDISGYFDMGMAGSNWSGQQENSLGDAVAPNDGYLYVQNDTGTSGGNLILGTMQQGKKTKITAGSGSSNVVAEFSSSNVTLHNSLVLTSGTIQTPYYTLPSTDGSNNQIIVTDGAGNLAWANVTQQTATYTANSITLTNGVYISGDVTSIQTFGDTGTGGYYYFTDGTNTGPAWIVTTDFINVVDFNRIVLNINYTQNSGHTVYVQMYNYDTSTWDSFGSYNGLAGYYQFALEVITSTSYVSAGVAQLRLYHNNTGNALHETKIDYIALEKSLQGPMGPKGAQGYQGVQGAVGAQGATGSQGSQGSQGNQGYQGDIGAQGYQGVQGATGSQGSQGYQGYQGYQGDVGTQGSQGVSVEVFFANTAPVSPMAGDQWVHSDTGIKYEYINDGTSSQWVSIPTTSNLGYTTGGGSTTVTSDTLSPFLLMGA